MLFYLSTLTTKCVNLLPVWSYVSIAQVKDYWSANQQGAPQPEIPQGPLRFALQPGSATSLWDWNVPCVPLPRLVPLPPPRTHTAHPGTLARSHRKLLADFSHIVTWRFVNSDKCNRLRVPSSVRLYASLSRHSERAGRRKGGVLRYFLTLLVSNLVSLPVCL